MASAFKRYRSAVTGRFISAKQSLKHPATSIAETVKRMVAKVRNK